MGCSWYAAFWMFLCVATVALTAPSAANSLNSTVNLNGALVCGSTGTPAAPNVTVTLLCENRPVLNANTTATGTVSASTTVSSRIRRTITSDQCRILLPPQACPGSANVTLTTTVTVSGSSRAITVTPASQIVPLST
nr:hypothetical protein Iba_scaffold655428CG0010 [Ipomoea batatas]GMC95153.1 hypothetical protein Iba_scaffold920655CG0010 [Ipomoea batatas]